VDPEHHTPEVEVNGVSPVFGLALREVRLCDGAGIVHQHVQAAELLFSEGDHPGDVGLGGHIGNDESRLPSFGVDLTTNLRAGAGRVRRPGPTFKGWRP
jgi:hypothetical protein